MTKKARLVESKTVEIANPTLFACRPTERAVPNGVRMSMIAPPPPKVTAKRGPRPSAANGSLVKSVFESLRPICISCTAADEHDSNLSVKSMGYDADVCRQKRQIGHRSCVPHRSGGGQNTPPRPFGDQTAPSV